MMYVMNALRYLNPVSLVSMTYSTLINAGYMPNVVPITIIGTTQIMSNEPFRFIEIYSTNDYIDRIINILHDAEHDEQWNGYTNKYNDVNLIYLGIGIIKLYFYIRSIDIAVIDFDTFIAIYQLKESIHYLKCNNIDIEYIINKLV